MGQAVKRAQFPGCDRAYLRKLRRNKFYGPNHATGTRWRVLKRVETEDRLYLLGANGSDRVVFGFWLPKLSPRMCPTDKFTSGARSGLELLAELVRERSG